MQVADDLLVKRDGGLDTAEHVFSQCPLHEFHGFCPALAVGDQQCCGRIIVGGEFIPGWYAGIQPDPLARPATCSG